MTHFGFSDWLSVTQWLILDEILEMLAQLELTESCELCTAVWRWRYQATSSVWPPSTGWAGDPCSPSARSDITQCKISGNIWQLLHTTIHPPKVYFYILWRITITRTSADPLRSGMYRLCLPPAVQRQQHHPHHQAPPLSPGEVRSLCSLRHRLSVHCRALPHLHQV